MTFSVRIGWIHNVWALPVQLNLPTKRLYLYSTDTPHLNTLPEKARHLQKITTCKNSIKLIKLALMNLTSNLCQLSTLVSFPCVYRLLFSADYTGDYTSHAPLKEIPYQISKPRMGYFLVISTIKVFTFILIGYDTYCDTEVMI